MKFKFGLLAVAAGLVFASASASASGIANSGGVYDMVFMAWDVNGTSYARDIGPESNLSATTNQTFNAAANSAFASTFAGDTSSQIAWAVVALDSDNGNIYTTGNLAQMVASFNNADGVGIDAPENESAAVSGWNAFNALGTNAAGEYIGPVSNLPNNPTFPGNIYRLASVGTQVYNGIGTHQNFIWQDSGNGDGVTGGAGSQGGAGQVIQLFQNANLANSNFGGGSNGGYFTLADGTGDLTWTVAVSQVPLPGAALLFAPALLGMLGFGRRRNQA
jgi:hypothetical protein